MLGKVLLWAGVGSVCLVLIIISGIIKYFHNRKKRREQMEQEAARKQAEEVWQHQNAPYYQPSNYYNNAQNQNQYQYNPYNNPHNPYNEYQSHVNSGHVRQNPVYPGQVQSRFNNNNSQAPGPSSQQSGRPSGLRQQQHGNRRYDDSDSDFSDGVEFIDVTRRQPPQPGIHRPGPSGLGGRAGEPRFLVREEATVIAVDGEIFVAGATTLVDTETGDGAVVFGIAKIDEPPHLQRQSQQNRALPWTPSSRNNQWINHI